jgi:asparagine synthase (glutamine-hydrolysing)
LLSGGLDSSLISAIAARICAKRVESGGVDEAWWPRLHSFSIGLEGSPDLAAAAKVAKHIHSVHHEIKFTIDEGLNAYRDVISHLETYDITTIRASTPMYLMSRYIRAQGVKMVLSGEGADEVFAGYLYFHKCPNKEEMQEELARKVKGLYKFDCLRANKATAAWGVEARVPFLDREFLDYAMNIDPAEKMCGVNGGGRIEKYILRKAFEGYLPDEILWRQKEQFSDGVGYSWIDSIRAKAADLISDADLNNAKYRFPINPPQTKEAYYIRQTFHSFFPQNSAAETVPGGPSVACSSATAIKWDENFKKMADCSGRSVAGVHVAAYSDAQRAAASAATNDKDVAGANLTFCTTFTEESGAAHASKKAKV